MFQLISAAIVATWLREFDACCDANGWKEDDKIKKLPALLRGPVASHFYAIAKDETKTDVEAVKKLTDAVPYSATRKLPF